MWNKPDPALHYQIHNDPSGLLQIAAFGLPKELAGSETMRFTFTINGNASRKTFDTIEEAKRVALSSAMNRLQQAMDGLKNAQKAD
jgi:hypothetical protein